MADIEILDHSITGWRPLRDTFGFVPDPMILRAAEMFLNGASAAKKIGSDDWEMRSALHENTGGICDFFDMIVTRDHIPFINYDDTFDMVHEVSSLRSLLGTQAKYVKIGYEPYQQIKAGALENMARLDLNRIGDLVGIIHEMGAFKWEWRPAPEAHPSVRQESLDAAQDALAGLRGSDLDHSGIVSFLLGGQIFSGMAQAADAVHHIQPKRARLYLGMTGSGGDADPLTHESEDQIFAAARAALENTQARAAFAPNAPPVLPYLLSLGPVSGPKDLLQRALEFRFSDDGLVYRALAEDLRGDGIKTREAEAISAAEKQRVKELLQPDPETRDRSSPLNVEFEIGLTSGLDVKLTRSVAIPAWLRFWWNDWVTFDGGLRKTLRRMWLAEGSYQNVQDELTDLWARA
ncbi:MAG: hypothetical protein AAFN27_15020 [Pseudomonadota bacterium]